jgi:hypothetical protein
VAQIFFTTSPAGFVFPIDELHRRIDSEDLEVGAAKSIVQSSDYHHFNCAAERVLRLSIILYFEKHLEINHIFVDIHNLYADVVDKDIMIVVLFAVLNAKAAQGRFSRPH